MEITTVVPTTLLLADQLPGRRFLRLQRPSLKSKPNQLFKPTLEFNKLLQLPGNESDLLQLFSKFNNKLKMRPHKDLNLKDFDLPTNFLNEPSKHKLLGKLGRQNYFVYFNWDFKASDSDDGPLHMI